MNPGYALSVSGARAASALRLNGRHAVQALALWTLSVSWIHQVNFYFQSQTGPLLAASPIGFTATGGTVRMANLLPKLSKVKKFLVTNQEQETEQPSAPAQNQKPGRRTETGSGLRFL